MVEGTRRLSERQSGVCQSHPTPTLIAAQSMMVMKAVTLKNFTCETIMTQNRGMGRSVPQEKEPASLIMELMNMTSRIARGQPARACLGPCPALTAHAMDRPCRDIPASRTAGSAHRRMALISTRYS
jgi:hypothetical protein